MLILKYSSARRLWRARFRCVFMGKYQNHVVIIISYGYKLICADVEFRMLLRIH